MSERSQQIISRHDLSIADVDRLEARIYEHNRKATGIDDARPFAFVAVDGQPVEIGAIAGYSWAGNAEIRQLWVHESHRGLGIGRKLLEAAVAEAALRGCQSVWAMSYDFQAPGLYGKCGFQRVCEVADWPPGHVNVILRRQL